MAVFDPEAMMRLVAGSIAVMQERRRWEYHASDSELRQFAEHVAMVCGWAPTGVGERLLDELGETEPDVTEPGETGLDQGGAYPLMPVQREVLPEAQRLARQLLDAVAVLEGDDADHDQRVAAAQTAVGHLSTGLLGSAYYPEDRQWWAAADGMHVRARQILRAQPADVRQTLFDLWTATDGPGYPGGGSLARLVGGLLEAGGVDGRGWLDRLGDFFYLNCGDWTGDLLRAEDAAGRPHPWALATWRRVQIESWNADTGATLWPVPSPGEPWADRAIAQIEAMPGERRAAWHALLTHCVPDKDQARPSAAWRKQAGPLLAAVGAVEFAERLDGWLELVGAPRSRPAQVVTDYSSFRFAAGEPRMPDRYNVRLVSGLLWVRGMCPPSEQAVRQLGQIAERATRKISGHGPASPKLANAAVAALADTDHPAAVAQLARLASRLTYKSTLRLVEKGLDARAGALGIAREDVEEMALPGFGLPLADKLGDCAFEVEIHGTDAVVSWRNAVGKPVKAVPSQVRADHREEFKELTAAVKDIGATLIATRDRLDGLLRRDRQWPADQWRERLLDHPLARTLARRLIWTVDGVACCWAADTLRTVNDQILKINDDATVRLWHPAGEDPETVAAWRAFLVRHQITQPFKQAHREQYLLTDAERATGTYSNRFAAHVVQQHRLNALLSRRGWSHQQWRNDAYSREPPRLALPEHGLRAELSIAGIDERDDMVFDTMATDQLRFLSQDGTPLALEQVPAVVLSEVMRDVDLFVAVAGVGSDPNWFDGGPHGRYREYWARTSFGELTPPGETRREVLAGLIPRLAIAGRCTLTDRFLEVRGDLHTYRIHYGSGNILIAPEGRYLCIIPASAKRAAEPELFLPFEGDSRLSEIISKALLLAADQKIKDPVILHQL